jgi:hypothetical protein
MVVQAQLSCKHKDIKVVLCTKQARVFVCCCRHACLPACLYDGRQAAAPASAKAAEEVDTLPTVLQGGSSSAESETCVHRMYMSAGSCNDCTGPCQLEAPLPPSLQNAHPALLMLCALLLLPCSWLSCVGSLHRLALCPPASHSPLTVSC